MDSFKDIDSGWKVVSSDGKQVGTVTAAREDHLVVRQGTILQHDLFIPMDRFTASDGRVVLNVAAADVDAEGWRYPPQSGYKHTAPAYPEVPETTTIQAAGYSAGTLSAPETQGFAKDSFESGSALAHPDAPDDTGNPEDDDDRGPDISEEDVAGR